MSNTMAIVLDISGLTEAQFQQLLQEVGDLALERADKRFTPGRPAMQLVFNVTHRPFSDVRGAMSPIFEEP